MICYRSCPKYSELSEDKTKLNDETGQGICCFNDFPASFKTNFINANFPKNSPEELDFFKYKIEYNYIKIV